MNARNKFFILLGIIFVIAAIYYFFSVDHSNDLVLIGTVDANQVIVSAQVEGRIQKLLVDEGTPVKAGDLIAVLDPSELQTQEAAAAANIASLQHKVSEMQHTEESTSGSTSSDVANARAKLSSAKAQLLQAQAALDRTASDSRRAIELAKAGFRVVATMRDLSRRDRLDQAATAAGVAGQLDIRTLDVTNFDALPGFVDAVVRDHGRLDVLVNNAGFAVAGFAEDIKLEELRRQFETNFFGAVAMTKAVLPTMRRQHSGHIIMVSSIGGLLGSVSVSSYSASKHALEGWSESLRLEVNALGIKVVLVEPGAYLTDIWTRGAVMGEKATQETSPNIQRILRMRDRIQALPKRDPIEVARLITSIAQDPNPKLRYLVGRDAKIQLAMKRILPWKWHEKVIANFLKID